MKQSNWERMQEIYDAALKTPRSERSAFLANACAGDTVLLREVKALLDVAESSGFLDIPVCNLSSMPESLVGMTIDGRYLVERELSRGGMSEVYFALDLKLHRQAVVIKVLSHELVQDSYARQKFEQEVEALLRIRHRGVVRVSDTGALRDGRPYIVMEYVEGEMLRSQIPREGMDLKRAASILKEIGEAVEHVHEKGICHRDLKPENIMLGHATDAVVLIDFGIAKVKDSAIASTTAHGASAGTLRYMSPEQLRGKEITAASDIYAMGLLAYEMLTGRPAFNPSSASQLLDMQRAGVRKTLKHLRENLSSRARTTILRALSLEPSSRYKSAKQFGDDLAVALLEPSVSAWNKRRLITVVTSLFVIVCVGLLSYAIYNYVTEPADPPLTSNGFNYWLMVQKMVDGKEYKEPVKSNGNERFENGDKFRLNVFSLATGYLYIFNEGPPEPGNISFRMIYPNKATNNASASIGANQTVQSDWITFRGPAGAENFWIVWSVSQVSELESAKNEALAHPQAGLTDQNLVRVKDFLTTMQDKIDARTTRYKARQEATVRSKSDLVVTLAQFEHR